MSTIIPCLLFCPTCRRQHVDEGPWAGRPHRTHLCEFCGHEWRPSELYLVGVRELRDNGHEWTLTLPEADPRKVVLYCRRCAKPDIAPVRRRPCLPIAKREAATRIRRKSAFLERMLTQGEGVRRVR